MIKANESKGKVVTLPPTKIDLHNANAIRRELSNLYRDMRNNKINPADGTKFAYVLEMIRKSYETCVLEDRIKQIEIIQLRNESNE